MAISLNEDFSPTYQSYFNKKYTCVANKEISGSTAIANFETLDKFVGFMYDRISPNLKRIIQNGLWQFYVCNFPKQVITSEEFQRRKKQDGLIKIFNNLKNGLDSLQKLKSNTTYNIKDLDVLLLLNGTVTNSQNPKSITEQNNLNTSQSTIICKEPTILSITPLTATTSGTMPVITISGTALFGKTIVTLNDNPTKISSNTNDILTFVPTIKTSGKIRIKTVGGDIVSTVDFNFIKDTSATTKQK
jgi:hypothetical protein